MIIIFGFDEYYPSGGTNDIVAIVDVLSDPTKLSSLLPLDFYKALEVASDTILIKDWNNETKEWELNVYDDYTD